jgi:hypothetical protein
MSETKKVDFYLDKFRNLNGKEFRIDKVNKPYRKGFDETTKRFRSFYAWPKDDRQVIESGDEKSIENGASASFDNCREKIWNKTAKKMEFHKYPIKDKSAFYKGFRKVFDVRITLKDTATFEKWDKTQVDAKSVMCEAVSASIIKNAIETLTDVTVPLIDGKDKVGKPAKVKPFDWEDSHVKALEGVYAKLKVTGEGMDTKYLVLPTAKFVTPEDDFGNDFGEVKKEDKMPEALPF